MGRFVVWALVLVVLVVMGAALDQRAAAAPPELVGVEEPFQKHLCDESGSVFGCDGPNTLTVPAGKRLVLEFVSGFCEVQGTATVLQYVVLRTVVGGSVIDHFFTLTPLSVPAAPGPRYTFTQQVRLYADTETDVEAFVSGFGFDSRRCFVQIVGHLRSL